MKYIRLTMQVLVCVVLVAYAALIFAVDHPRVQEALAKTAEEQMSGILQTKVSIGRVELGLFNAVELHDVILHDRSDSVMLDSKLVYAKLKVMPLLKGKVFLRNIVVLDADIALYRRHAGEAPNFQFLIDTFKSKDKRKKRTDLTINSLIFRRCQVAYDEHDVTNYDEKRFNRHHIQLSDLDANISLKEFSDDSLNVRVRNLAFRERSGITLDELKFHLIAGKRKAALKEFRLQTPHSHIIQDRITAQYNSRDRKTFMQTLNIRGSLQDILVGLDDLAPFAPQMKDCGIALSLATDFEATTKTLELKQLSIADDKGGNNASLLGNIRIESGNHGISNAHVTVQTLTISPAMTEKVFTTILQRPVPAALFALLPLKFSGDGSYHAAESMEISGITAIVNSTLTTNAGTIATKASMKQGQMKAHVATTDFNTSLLAKHKLMPQTASFEVDVEADMNDAKELEDIIAEIALPRTIVNNIEYHDITAQIAYDRRQSSLSAHLQSDNAGAKLSANAEMVCRNFQEILKKLPEQLHIDAEIDEFCPRQLNLTERYNNGTFAMNVDADIKHPTSPEKMQADIRVSGLTLDGDIDDAGAYLCKQILLKAVPSSKGQHLTLRSDFADLEYEGPFRKQELKELFINALSNILNTENCDEDIASSSAANENNRAAAFVLTFKDAEILRRMAGINIRQKGTIHANGHVGKGGESMAFSIIAPEIAFGKFGIKDLSLFAQHEEKRFNLLAKASKDMRNGRLLTELTMEKDSGGRILTDINWQEALHKTFYGKVETATHLELPRLKSDGKYEGNFELDTEFMPTQMCLSDSIWNFEHANVTYSGGCVGIRNFGFHSGKQHLLVNGTYERGASDPIIIDLRNLDLEYILALARLNVVEFGGHATGRAMVRQLSDGSPWASATVNVPDLTFNRAPLGNGNVTIGWDHAKRDIVIDGDIREAGQGFTIVKGYVDPVHRDLDLQTESLNTQLGFINKYTEGIFENIKGRATGHCRIHGGFRTIVFEGRERGSAEATIPITGVTYKVENADIDIRHDAFVFKHADIKDLFQGKGEITGKLAHDHIKNMRYDFNISGENLRLYDKPRELDMPFYATANGSGKVRLHGSPGKMNAEMQLQTQAGSELTYILDSPDADVSQLLKIRSQEESAADSLTVRQTTMATTGGNTAENTKTDINLYFEVNVDPQSCLHLVTDDKSGDAITVYGEGPIQANYHNKSGFKMFGIYNIQRGTYGLNIPMLAQRKKFDILPGGQVRFYGDPMTADVNVKARYVVNSASLADLNIGTGFANNTTRVDCLVNIYGEVANMQFDLDFDLPNVSEDEKQMVHSLIASDEERTTQVLYLLGLGRFYAYNFTTNDAGQNQSTLMMNSLLSSTLSSQLNSIISNAIGSSNWTFGTNISTGQMGWNDTEVEGLVSSRLLNNRLLINGNFGYSNRQAATTNFVGDFDMQYLITPKGTVSIKAYSETNDRYFTKSTLTTQGVGLQLKRDFTKFKELFTTKKRNKRKK